MENNIDSAEIFAEVNLNLYGYELMVAYANAVNHPKEMTKGDIERMSEHIKSIIWSGIRVDGEGLNYYDVDRESKRIAELLNRPEQQPEPTDRNKLIEMAKEYLSIRILSKGATVIDGKAIHSTEEGRLNAERRIDSIAPYLADFAISLQVNSQQPEQQGWISVKDELPKEQRVYVCRKDGKRRLSFYDNGKFYAPLFADTEEITNEVTHFMYFPKAPITEPPTKKEETK